MWAGRVGQQLESRQLGSCCISAREQSARLPSRPGLLRAHLTTVPPSPLLAREQFANSVPREFWLLLGRAWRQASRNKLLIVSAWLGLQAGVAGLGCSWADRHANLLCMLVSPAAPVHVFI